MSVGGADDLAEVEVERQDDPRFSDGLVEDVVVREAVQTLVPQVDGVVALRAQPGDDPLIHAHVGEEAHDSRAM